MKCPFCNAELCRIYDGSPAWTCPNRGCKNSDYALDKEIWQALIDGKKAQEALEIAIDCLIPIANTTCRECCDEKLAQITLNEIKKITEPKEE